ncbi:MAG: DUF1538 domain-containing protein [Pseudomonadota bacterium]
MTDWLLELLDVSLSTVRDVTPIAAIIFGFQGLVLRRRIPNLKNVLTGFVLVLAGLTLFLVGLERALFPIGRVMATQLSDPEFINTSADSLIGWQRYYWIYIFAFAIGFATTVAEPALIAVAMKASEVSGGAVKVWGLRAAVALGVAVGIALGAWRIVTGLPLHYFIIAGYIIVIIQTVYAPRMIIALAYDSGGVTTSTVTVPLVTALGLGLAETVPGRSPLLDGFGLIAFASVFPIMTVMGYAQLAQFQEARARRAKERG